MIRQFAAEAAAFLESAGDLAGARRLHFLLATTATGSRELIRGVREQLDACEARPDSSDAATALRAQAMRTFNAINTRITARFDAQLADLEHQSLQKLALGIGEAGDVLRDFQHGIAELALNLETQLYTEIAWLVAGMAHETGGHALADLTQNLPAVIRKHPRPVTLQSVESGEAATTTALGLVASVSRSGQVANSVAQLTGVALDPSGILAIAATVAGLTAWQQHNARNRAARGAVQTYVTEACAQARKALLEPIQRGGTQAQITILDQAIAALAHRNAASIRGTEPMLDTLRRRARDLEGQAPPD
jgi:hypothetical protein